MKASVALLLASFLLPPLVAEDEHLSFQESSSLSPDSTDNTNNDDGMHHSVSAQGQEDETVDSSLKLDPDRNEEQLYHSDVSSDTIQTAQTAVDSENRMQDDESLVRLPSHQSHLSAHRSLDDSNYMGPFLWPSDYSSSNSVAIPPYRPLHASFDDFKLSMKKLKETKQRIQRRKKRKQVMCNHSNFRCEFPTQNMTIEQQQQYLRQRCFLDEAAFCSALSQASREDESEAPTLPEEEDVDSVSKGGDEKDAPETSRGEEVHDIKSTTDEETTQQETTQKREEERVVVDYAGKSSGALIIEKSSGWKGTSNLLTADNDQYAMVPTEEENKSLIISLSEEILVKKVILSNYERYSNNVKEFSILGSQTMTHWSDLGTYQAKPGRFGRQEFDLKAADQLWARYLKFKFLTHYGEEHYLTITQISVHGTTMQQGFHEQWEDKQDQDLEPQQEETESQIVGQTNSTEALSNSTESDLKSASVAKGEPIERQDLLSEETQRQQKTHGIDKNGYLLYSWIMPQPPIEAGFDWTVLPSASVYKRLAITRPCLDRIFRLKGIMKERNNIGEIPTQLAVFRSSKSQKERRMIAEMDSPIPTLWPEQSRVVSDLLPLIRAETGSIIDETEFKGRLVLTRDIPIRKVLSALNEPDPGTLSMTNKATVASSETKGGEGKVESELKGQLQSENAENGAFSKPNVIDSIPDNEPLHSTGNGSTGIFVDRTVVELLLGKVPSASCLQELNISNYKKKSTPSRSNAGATNNGPSTGGMEPIFKKLTDEIKSLQAAVSVHDRFAKDAISCFQRVLFDLVLVQEQERVSQNQRLEHLESIISGRFLYSAFGELLYTFGSMLSPAYYHDTVERSAAHFGKIDWIHTFACMLEHASWSSFLGFPLFILCMVFYRYRYRIQKKAL